jgi:DNA modification methylase
MKTDRQLSIEVFISPGRNGELNKLYANDLPIHDWYRFVLSFPPHLVRHYIQRFALNSNHKVLDPFCGTGTALVECKKLGLPSVGIEAHPMLHFASCVKVDWSPKPDELVKHAHQVAEAASSSLESYSTLKSYRTLPPETFKFLLKDSISPLPLHKSLFLLDAIHTYRDHRFYDHERLALAKALVYSIGNLHFGPEVGIGAIKDDAPVIACWLSEIEQIARDLSIFQKRAVAPTMVYHADSRQILDVLDPQSIDAVITSPPYPNEKDYTRTTRLETVLLGFVRNKAELQTLKQMLLRSNTRNVYKGDKDDQFVADHPEIQKIAEAIEHRRIELGKTSGFERLYARVTRLYFGGMAKHLAELRRVLRPGAYLAYVVGDQASYLRVMIRTGQLLADIVQSLGYKLVSIDLFRTRLATATKEQLREEVVVLRWPGEK